MTSFDVSSAITLNTYVRQYCQPWCLLKSDNLLKNYILKPIPLRESQEIKHLGATYDLWLESV